MINSDHRYRSLDSLRGVAAVLVVFFHISWNNHITAFHFFQQSFLFVDLFFILSGFIISTVYGQRLKKSSDALRFMTRRFFRLYPLHLATLLFLVALETIKYLTAMHGLSSTSEIFAYQRTIPAIFVNLAFLQGTGILESVSWNAPSWSIGSEMIAYAVFASIAPIGLVASRFFWLIIIPIVAGYGYLVMHVGTLNTNVALGIIRCLCGFFLGTLIARMPPALFPNTLVIVSAVTTLLVVALLSGTSEILAVPAFAVLIYALRNDEITIAKLFLAKPLAFLGKISFSIYLVHYLVISLIGTVLKVSLHAQVADVAGRALLIVPPLLGDLLVAVTVIFTLAIAKLTYERIEIKGRSLGYRLTEERATGPLVSATRPH
jgi:peptidoglycan/LPS O-acetylase OafA/YrhL